MKNISHPIIRGKEYTEKYHKNIHRKKPYRTIFVTDTVDSRTDKIHVSNDLFQLINIE